MKVSLKIYITNHEKILPYIEEENFEYTLVWNSWHFHSLKHGLDNTLTIPEFVANIPDDTSNQDLKDFCKELSEKLMCLVEGDWYSLGGGHGFHGDYENGEFRPYSPQRSPEEISKIAKDVLNEWKCLRASVDC
jgi:hypothetical protein